MAQSRKSRIIISGGIVLIVFIALIGWLYSMRASLKPENVKVGMSANNARVSWKTFSYNEQGHFGKKIQFEGRLSDSKGGNYSLHCKDGNIFAVEISFPAGLQRKDSLEVVKRVLQPENSEPSEHDAEELSLKNCDKPTEYFYFDQGKLCAQLDYSGHNAGLVSRIYCWKS